MKTLPKWQKGCLRCLAFSLVELMVVIAVVGLLSVLIIPAASSINAGYRMTSAGQIVADQISTAKKLAMTRSIMVEVRMIASIDRQTAGYSAIQLWSLESGKDSVPLTSLARLPEGTTISQNEAVLSQLLAICTNGNMPIAHPSAGASYAAFSIFPSGRLSPSATNMADLFLSIVPSRLADASELPENAVVVQVNPVTGTPRIHRP